MLSNINIGDNLSTRTLTVQFDGTPSFDSGEYVFIETDAGNRFVADSANGRNRIRYTYSGLGYITIYDSSTSYSVDSISLPDGYGTVISIDPSVPAYGYIKRNTHEKLFVYDEDYGRRDFSPEYVPGDVLNLYHCIAAGNLTSNNKSVQFFIPLPKPVSAEVHSVSWYAYGVQIRHSDGGYILNNGALEDQGTVTTDFTANGIYAVLTLNNASSFTNNCPVTVYFGQGDRLVFNKNS
jgi:hypothetical protein